MAKPSISTVKSWRVVFESDRVLVEAGSSQFTDDFWRVKPKNGDRAKSFYGESAWSDAQRMAADIDFDAWGF